MTDQQPIRTGLRSLRLHPDGMSCASCVARTERVLAAVPGVAEARVSLADESADIRYSDPATPEALAEALARAGYPARQERLTLSVEGMSCASCTGRVERVLKAQPGVIEATANLASRRAQVTLWEARPRPPPSRRPSPRPGLRPRPSRPMPRIAAPRRWRCSAAMPGSRRC